MFSILVILCLFSSTNCIVGVIEMTYWESSDCGGDGSPMFYPLDNCLENIGNLYLQPGAIKFTATKHVLTATYWEEHGLPIICKKEDYNVTKIPLGKCWKNPKEPDQMMVYTIGELKSLGYKDGYFQYDFLGTKGDTCDIDHLSAVWVFEPNYCTNTCREAVCESTKDVCDKEKGIVVSQIFRDKDCLQHNLMGENDYNGTCLDAPLGKSLTSCDVIF